MLGLAADAVVGEALVVQGVVVPDIASVKDDRAGEFAFDEVKVGRAELVPLGAHYESITLGETLVHVVDVLNVEAVLGKCVSGNGIKCLDGDPATE